MTVFDLCKLKNDDGGVLLHNYHSGTDSESGGGAGGLLVNTYESASHFFFI